MCLHISSPPTSKRAWVLTDGDNDGKSAANALRDRFSTWPETHFQSFVQPQFERYYPAEFDARVGEALGLSDRDARRKAKARLVEDVTAWLRESPERGRLALEGKAGEVVRRIQEIEKIVAQQGRPVR